jgi:hypothetical protein
VQEPMGHLGKWMSTPISVIPPAKGFTQCQNWILILIFSCDTQWDSLGITRKTTNWGILENGIPLQKCFPHDTQWVLTRYHRIKFLIVVVFCCVMHLATGIIGIGPTLASPHLALMWKCLWPLALLYTQWLELLLWVYISIVWVHNTSKNVATGWKIHKESYMAKVDIIVPG